jgi:hypothetical protein
MQRPKYAAIAIAAKLADKRLEIVRKALALRAEKNGAAHVRVA